MVKKVEKTKSRQTCNTSEDYMTKYRRDRKHGLGQQCCRFKTGTDAVADDSPDGRRTKVMLTANVGVLSVSIL